MATQPHSPSPPETKELGSERRGQQWVDPEFQKRTISLFIVLILLLSTVLVGTFYFHTEKLYEALKNSGLATDPEALGAFGREIQGLVWSLSFAVLVFCVLVGLLANHFSHRIVGPVYAVKRSLEALSRGDYHSARLRLRPGDEFQDMATSINQLVDQHEKLAQKK